MRFKHILAGAFALALTLPLLTVSAHPGHTDSNGGHTDHETGNYHYHHGYPAHDHYDMDGDGAVDCLYDFDDQTASHNNGSIAAQTSDTANTYTGFHSLFSSIDLLWDQILNVYVLFSFIAIPVIIALNEISFRLDSSQPYISERLFNVAVALTIATLFISGIFVLPFYSRNRKRRVKQSKSFPVNDPDVHAEDPLDLCATPFLNHSRSQHQHFCLYLWGRVIAFLDRSGIPRTNANCGKTFAVFFYIAIKVIRSQDFADEIYRVLPEILCRLLAGSTDVSKSVGAVLAVYKSTAPELNESGIDPLAPDGINQLWEFASSRLVVHDLSCESAMQLFAQSASDVVRNANSFRENASPYYVHHITTRLK